MSSSILTDSIVFAVFGLAVYLVTRFFHFEKVQIDIQDPKRSALFSVVAILIGLTILTIVYLSIRASGKNQEFASQAATFKAGPGDIIGTVILALVLAGPSLIVIGERRESLSSLGLSSTNLVRSLILGLIVSAAYFLLSIASQRLSFVPFRMAHLWAFLDFSVVGFSEEFVFRGYLQTRFVNLFGKWKGWALASVMMALYHIPAMYGIHGSTFIQSIISSLSIIPISLFLGYLMLRTQNLVAPAIFHTFFDWLGTLIA